MDDNRIEIVASLDIPKTVSTIEKDLEEVKKRLDSNKALSIACSLDTSSLVTLQNQVSEISKKLKIDIPKIEIQAGTGQSVQNIENVAKSVETVTNKVLTLKKTLADLDSRFVEPFKAVTNTDGIINAERTMATIQSRLSSLGTVTVTGKYNDQESADSINKIIARIQAASGEVRELNFLLDSTGQKFEYIGGSYTDKGVGKIQQDLARLSKELANFEASHKSIESGLIEPLTTARNAIIDLESGVGSVESAQKALDNLKTAAANIGTSLKSTGSSFNIFDNAINKAKNFDNTLNALRKDIDALSDESAKSSLGDNLANASKNLVELQRIESESGRGLEWSKKYGEVSQAIQDITNGLKAAQKEENALSRETSLSNKIKKLSADMQAYAAANKRAIDSTKQMSDGTTFASKWADLTSRMAKGADLSASEIKHLGEEFRIFGKEAEAAGLKGESAFGKFLNSFKTMSSYITANMVFNAAKRQLRQMIEEVRAVDTAMVELRKVTTATEYEFQEFAKSATKTGVELGASVSDVINATATFARLGESLPDAEELGRVATLYKNVGDGIDIETASEDIISTMKAFKIEAKDAIKLVDKFNEVGNNFAISSGGIGEALKRSASALAAANNDISQSIALITTANTIAQDPTTVGQGIKTMSLRIRSTKTQLEDLGEDAEGAAENVSKLREQMLALTGVDIQLNKNTYKSTYQILLEMSKVWDKLDDMTQASVLEQLFGKRQANIGAAILSNGELLQQVYETSEKASDGIGSAMREQEEYAKSIQYNLDSLKASYQELAQQIVQSETVVAIVKALNEALQSLSSSEIIVGINAVSHALISLTKTAIDVKDKLEDIPVAGNFVSRGLDEVRGIGFLKSAAKIYEWLNKDEKAAEEAAIKQEELNSKYEKSLKVYDEESESLRSLETEYLKLVANTQDAESAKEGLLALQNSVTERYEDEADGLNLVNKSLEENVKWLIERQKVLDESFVKENKEVIEQAKSKFGVESADEKSKHGFGNLSFGDESEIDNEARREVKLYTRAVSEYLKQYYPDIFESAITEGEYGFGINAGITPREQERAAELLVKAYEQAFEKYKNLQNKVLDTDEIKEYQRQWVESISKSVDILEKASKATENVDIIESFIGNKEDSDRFSELLLKLNQFNDILNSDASSFGEKIDASNEINQTVDALNDIAQKYPAIADLINQQIESVGLSFNHVTDTFETAKSAWLKTLDEAQKGVVTNVDKITDAMKKIYQGDAIDSKAAWDIINLDNSKLLANIQIDQNGNYQFRVEELVALKDKLIEKEIEHQEEIINTAKINKESAEAEIATAKVQLESIKVRLAAAKAPNSMATNVKELENEYNRLESGISTTEDAVTAYDYAIRNASLYSDELRRRMGDLSGTTEILQARVKKLKDEVSQLNTEADNVLKAYEASVDDVIKKYEAEVKEIEKSKQGLEDQLKILEEQEDELEQIVENHKAVSSIVTEEIEAQISAIEDSRKEVEDYYDNLIDKLKTENEEREDAIEYEKKLANLANAQNNKVRVYDQERGWTYQVNKEALEEAENDLESYKKNQEIKALEDEKEAKLEGYDDQIKAFEDYSKEWSEITEGIDKAEDERLATEMLGSEWREKIKNKDTSMMNSFKSSYQNYTTQLNSVVKNEINALNDSIEAKDKEIEATKDQIQVWQDYKNEIKSAADTIKNGLEDYVEYLGDVKINEQSTNEQRLAALNEFATKYRSIIDSITDKNGEIDNLENQINDITESMSNFKLGATGGTLLGGITTGMQVSNAFGGILQALVKAFEQLFGSMPHFAKGGTAGFTGMAYLDGTPHSAETIFTAAQSKKLYEYVNAMPEISKMFSVRSDALTGKAMDNSAHVSIGSMTVVANNPQEFANQFDKQMARYWKTKLTENKVY